ncbi:MAG: PPOX class F420-dependent oxidoreductase [Jatrophihabitantaceae bacterium]
MTSLPAGLRDLVRRGPLVHLATINSDGSPQVTVVWMGLDGDRLVSAHMHRNLKVRNMQHDPRVVLSFDAPRQPGVFLAEHAVLRATASVTDGGAWQQLDDLAKVYLGPDVTFPAPRAPGGFVVRYSVDRIGGVGPWAG